MNKNSAKIAKKNIWKKRISIGVVVFINLITEEKFGGVAVSAE